MQLGCGNRVRVLLHFAAFKKSIQCVAQTQIAFFGTKSSGRQTYVVYFLCAKAAKGLGSLLLFFIRPPLRHWKLSALTPTCAQCRHCSVTLFSLLIFMWVTQTVQIGSTASDGEEEEESQWEKFSLISTPTRDHSLKPKLLCCRRKSLVITIIALWIVCKIAKFVNTDSIALWEVVRRREIEMHRQQKTNNMGKF